jgi:2-methylisocitrate lyase-like PEP mutase family enzyme
MTAIAVRHQRFQSLHKRGCFVLPNPWDAGSARVMAALGAQALATSSAGFAFTLGRPDMGHVSRDEALAHSESIVAATPLPVSGDLENGFADAPEDVAETIRLAAEVGLSGCSIEDTVMSGDNPAYGFDLAVERVRAAAAAARALGRPFVFCARADGVMNGAYGVEEAIRRIQAFEKAGADVLYVPLPPNMESLVQVVKSVSKPVNALAAGRFAKYSKADFAKAGVRRISTGSAIARATQKVLVDATTAMLDNGDFTPLLDAASGKAIDYMLQAGGDDA